MTCPTNRPAWLPLGMTEAEVLEAIEEVARRLAKTFAFGVHGPDDIAQVARMESIVVLSRGKYDPSRPLTGYLYTHVFRRLVNLRREFVRVDKDLFRCKGCYQLWQDGSRDGCGRDDDDCRAFKRWAELQAQKARLAFTRCVFEESNESALLQDSQAFHELSHKDLLERIDRQLPAELRADYLKLREGIGSVSKARRRLVQEAILNILNDDDIF